jgi:hypothetical protein
MIRIKRVRSLLLCMVMVITILPGVTLQASAASLRSAAIRLDASNNFGIMGTGSNWVYVGKYSGSPIMWRVLSTNKNGNSFLDNDGGAYTGRGLFLLSEKVLGTTRFKADNSSNTYQGSDLQAYCNSNLYSSCFSTQEQAAILATTKNTASDPAVEFWGSTTLNNDKLFSLSVSEATNSSYGFNSGDFNQPDTARRLSQAWQLRSPHPAATIAAVVITDGSITNGSISSSYYVRPAFNINLSDVLFTSAAQDGKSASGMSSGLTAISETAPTAWKLTLLDNTRTFNVTTSSASVEAGGTASISYTGATSGTNEFISAMLVDADGNAIYYGRVKAVESGYENGTANIDIPTGLAAGSYTLKLFSEQYNGDFNTDYASAFNNVALSVLSDTTAPIVSAATPDGTGAPISGNITVTFGEEMRPGAGTVSLDGGATSLTGGTWSVGNTRYTVPYSGLAYATPYTVKISGFMDYSGNVMADNTSYSFTTMPMADLAVTITDGVTTATSGGAVTYTITATNSGPSDTTAATVTCIFPAGLINVTWTATGSGGGTPTAFGTGNINDMVTLPTGASVSYTVSAFISISATGTLSTTATVTAPPGTADPNTENNSKTDTDTLISADASLSGLTLSQGSLSPAFSNGTYNYTASVANSVTSLTVTPTASNTNATIKVNGAAVSSGNASNSIALVVGPNTVTVDVTAENGTTQNYIITVNVAYKILTGITAPSAITGVANGTAKTAAALGLPDNITLVTNDGNVQADVSWDVASSSYNASSSIAQSFTVNGIVTLPGDVINPNNVPLNTNIRVTVNARSNGGGNNGGGGAPSEYQADVDTGNGLNTKLPVIVDINSGSAVVDVGTGNNLMTAGQTMVVALPSVPDVDTYILGVPVHNLTTPDQYGKIVFKTDNGSMIVPSNMLTGAIGISGSKAEISIGQGDKSGLPSDVKTAIGDKPLISLSLSVDGKQTDWSNPDAPVTVSIPYTPTTAELQNPESIVIWYIDGSGNAVSVPNGHYDPATGTVTFTTTHFSNYAVVYNKVSFTDVSDTAWYSDAVGFISARGITTGTGTGCYSPDAKLTRGEFMVMLMKAYGIDPDESQTDNFSDAGSAYYTSYLAAAKQLGISEGIGNNLFAPDREITRQEMFTMLYNALNVIGKLPEGNSGTTLTDFTDAGQIDSWAKQAMTLLVETGTISGSGGKLNPTSTTTRAEIAQVLYNLLSK